MKKILSVLLMIALLLPVMAVAEGEDWFEVSADGDVLTVRLPYDVENGCQWNYQISDEEYLQLLKMESADGVWTAEFASADLGSNDAVVTLLIVNEVEAEADKQGRELELYVDNMNKLTVRRWKLLQEQEMWYSMFDPAVLSVKLPVERGSEGAWSIEISDETVLETISATHVYNGAEDLINGLDSTFVASFRALKAGDVQVSLNFAREGDMIPIDQRIFYLYADKDMLLQPKFIEQYGLVDGLVMLQDITFFPEKEVQWFSLEDPTVLTINLPMDDAENNPWTFAISDESVLELITMETVANADGTGVFVASFRGLKAGEAELIVTDANGTALAESGDMINAEHKLSLVVNENLEISIQEALNVK